MTKKDLSTKLADRTGMSKSQAHIAVEQVIDIVRAAVLTGENIYLRGFGTIKVINYKETKGRIIKEGKTVIIPAHRAVRFKPCPKLKKAL